MKLNTLASVFTRTRKREVTHAAVRAPVTVRIALSPAERAFCDAVLAGARDELRTTRPGAPGFAAMMRERQAASCLPAYRQPFDGAARRSANAALGVDASVFDLHQLHQGEETAPAPRSTGGRGPRADGDDVDTKFDRFEDILRQALAEGPESKALVFSFFKGTLEYLRGRLQARGIQVGVIHGDVPLPERRRIIDTFASTSNFRVLLSSEVGAEGLDFQFCDVLVNYDLPWNPMQVEQRIGRLDRFGQRHERIRIYNFYIEDTIETRVFQRLYERIGLFERSIGDLEAILGEEIAKLSREAIQARLTPEEEANLANQAVERIIRRQQDQDDLERHKDALLGQGAILDQQIEGTINSGRVVSPDELRALVGTFLRASFPNSRMVFDEQEPCATLDVDAALGHHMRRFIEQKRINHRTSAQFRSAITDRRRLSFTFDNDFARQRPNLEFITIRHPLVEAALEYWAGRPAEGIPAGEIQISGPAQEQGLGYFFIYLVKTYAATQSTTLETVIALDSGGFAIQSGAQLLRQIQEGAPIPKELARSDDAFAAAERAAFGVMAGRRTTMEADARGRNRALLLARATSLTTSFDAKLKRTEELLGGAEEERIRRMRTAQLHNLRAKRDAKLAELHHARDATVSSLLVAGGRVHIVATAGEDARRTGASG